MSEEEFMAIAHKRYEEVNALHDGMSFYDFEKRLSEIMEEMTRELLDSKIGQRGLTLTGGGDLFIENTSVNSSSFISFRADYGPKCDGGDTHTELQVNTQAECQPGGCPAIYCSRFRYRKSYQSISKILMLLIISIDIIPEMDIT